MTPLVVATWNVWGGNAPGTAGLRNASAEVGPTMPNPSPVVRLDYVLTSSDLVVRAAWHLGEQPETNGFLASDHLGVAVALEL